MSCSVQTIKVIRLVIIRLTIPASLDLIILHLLLIVIGKSFMK